MSNPIAELNRFDDLCRRHGSDLDLTDEEIVDALMTGETDLKEICEAIVADIDDLEVLKTGLTAKIKEFQAREVTFAGQIDRAKAVIFRVIERMPPDKRGKRSMKLATATLTYKSGTPKVVITDEKAIPFDLMRSKTPEPDKTAIMEELKSGITVPGATLSNGAPSLQIRRK